MFQRLANIIIINIFVVTPIFGNRKYDIEQECMKLYGEDLKSVLLGFRRSSDYLGIIKREWDDHKSQFTPVVTAILNINLGEMKDKIYNMHNVSEEKKREDEVKPDTRLCMLRNKHIFGKNAFTGIQGFSFSLEPSDNVLSDETAVNRLDHRAKELAPKFSHDDQVTFRNLGFEYAGKVIHEIIKAIGDEQNDENEIRSTRLPYGGLDRDTKEAPTVPHYEHTVVSLTEVVQTSTYNAPQDNLRQKKGKHKNG